MGRFPFSPPTILAPMEGVTRPLFRQELAARGGVGLVCTEFVRISRSPLTAEALRTHVVKSAGVPLSVQLMGRDVEAMVDAARVLTEAGADVIDVNMGCPTKAASKNGVGAAMLKDPELVLRVVSALREQVKVPLSVKMRAGFDDAEHVLTLARNIERGGADFLTIHPRLRRDRYEGVADWRIIGLVKQSVSIPVVGNGDCWYAADASRMQEQTGCDAVMIGRPAIRNPWIFEQIAALREGRAPRRPSGADLYDHIARTAALYGEVLGRRAIGPVKELVRWCARAADDDRELVRALMRRASLEELLVEAERRLRPLPASALDLGPEGELRRERSGQVEVGDAAMRSALSRPRLVSA